uniref:diphthine methyl ester synthase n=1 Tax=Percolomonas cosmopolitus TaxID=63605 RepID=A0A7S1PJ69_9EUKA|mmetsp:Transcript_9551/g.35401  ORF Transcript_9551/g.35401 Transcript_9551/m.35401 type:complete len:293 (+) Transcript_9551:101-979(+)
MVLFLIGLGLGSPEDITLRGLKALKKCQHIFLEAYTSRLPQELQALEKEWDLPENSIQEAWREDVEQHCEEKILEPAKDENVALMVVGDPFGATTHTDIVVRAREMGIKVEVIHNVTIMSAVACCGLQLYRFGQTVSIPFFEDNWKPTSFYEKTAENFKIGLQTLCLLDIKTREQTVENLMRGNDIFEPPRFMTVNQAIDQFLEAEKELGLGVIDEKNTLCVGLARVGQVDEQIAYGTFEAVRKVDFGRELHSFIVIAGEDSMDEIEKEFLEHYRVGEKVEQVKEENDEGEE